VGSRWVPRLVVAAVAGASMVAVSTPAWADSTAVLNQSNVFADQTKFGMCVEKPNQSSTEDIWVFVWPGGMAGDLLDLTLNFDNNGDNIADAQRTEADGTKTIDNGTLKVWVTTPAGWKLLNGTSLISGTVPQNQFQLTHTCGGTTTPTPGPTPSTDPTPTPSGPEPSEPNPSEPNPSSPEPSGSSPGTTPGTPGGGGGLPLTGTSVAGIVVFGMALITVGAAFLAVRRRRTIFDSEA